MYTFFLGEQCSSVCYWGNVNLFLQFPCAYYSERMWTSLTIVFFILNGPCCSEARYFIWCSVEEMPCLMLYHILYTINMCYRVLDINNKVNNALGKFESFKICIIFNLYSFNFGFHSLAILFYALAKMFLKYIW